MNINYFSVLPFHPRPKSLESLTSYLIRLGVTNGVTTLSDLANLLSLEDHIGTVNNFNDCPPMTLGNLASITTCAEDILLKTTFYHPACKFNRTIRAALITKFLTVSVSDCLRYCPSCIEQREYYSLIWRFLYQKGCPEHDCLLLDKCEDCGQKIPLLTNPLIFGVCPNCKKSLKSAVTVGLSKRAREIVARRQRELEFLIVPHPCETLAPDIISIIGRELRKLRLNKQQSIRQVAKILKIEPSEVFFAEEGRNRNGLALFSTYLIYADYLEVTLSALFEEALALSKTKTKSIISG